MFYSKWISIHVFFFRFFVFNLPRYATVVPKDGPHISDGGRQSFQNGETMELNCTSGRSYPATTLQWYLNDLLVTDPNNIIQYPEVQNQHGLITTFLGLSMVVNHRHYIDGTIRIKCVANLSPVLWRGGQESIVQWEQPPIDNRVAMLLGEYLLIMLLKSRIPLAASCHATFFDLAKHFYNINPIYVFFSPFSSQKQWQYQKPNLYSALSKSCNLCNFPIACVRVLMIVCYRSIIKTHTSPSN